MEGRGAIRYRRGVRAAPAPFLAALAAVAALVAAARAEPAAPPPASRFSLLAVGDTGSLRRLPWLREGQRAVAAAMEAEDARAPVDGLVLLGDLFYPAGLTPDELVHRVRENLVRPYCAFVELEAPRSDEVSSACARPPRAGGERAVYAVLGNHDTRTAASRELTLRGIAGFVSNWRAPGGLVAVYEAAPGVSLILFESPDVRSDADLAPVRAAVRASRGPWRILVSHHPIAAAGGINAAEWGLSAAPEDALAVADAPVQLHLAGHRHNLQVIEGRPPAAALQVVAGSGATIHRIQYSHERQRFALERTGFARVDLVEAPGERLVVSLYATPRYPFVFWEEPELVARFSVDRDGAVREELDAGKSASSASSSEHTP